MLQKKKIKILSTRASEGLLENSRNPVRDKVYSKLPEHFIQIIHPTHHR